MNPFTAGALLGIVCTIIVAFIGVKFFPENDTGWINIGLALRTFARGILGVVSICVAVFGLIFSIAGGAFHMYLGWLIAYAVGLFLYFFLRYGLAKSR